MEKDVKALVQQVNAALLAGEPDNISVDTYGGYTGYKPQYIIDALNDVLGFGGWGFEEMSNTIADGLAVAQVRVWITGVEFTPTGWGQGRVTKSDYGDARKSAQTDAIKKTFSYFSIGSRAYRGLLPNPEGNKNKQQAQARRPAQAPGQPQQAQPANGQRTQAQQQPQQRPTPVVAVPASPSVAQPTPINLLAQAQAVCFDVYGPDSFEQVSMRLFKQTEGLSNEQLKTMIKKLRAVQEKKQQPAASAN